MEVFFLDDKFYQIVTAPKGISLENINNILKKLGIPEQSIVFLDKYETKILGSQYDSGWSIGVFGVKNELMFRFGIGTVGESQHLVVWPTDKFGIECSNEEISALGFSAFDLMVNNDRDIPKISNGVYGVRKGDYLLRCTLDVMSSSDGCKVENEDALNAYLQGLNLPLGSAIIDVYKQICEITGKSFSLQVVKGDNVVDSFSFGIDSDDYSFCMTTRNEFISGKKQGDTVTWEYKKWISTTLPDYGWGNRVFDEESLPTDSVGYMYVVVNGDSHNCGVLHSAKCDSSLIGEYFRLDFISDIYRGKNLISQIRGGVNEFLPFHSKYCRKRREQD